MLAFDEGVEEKIREDLRVTGFRFMALVAHGIQIEGLKEAALRTKDGEIKVTEYRGADVDPDLEGSLSFQLGFALAQHGPDVEAIELLVGPA